MSRPGLLVSSLLSASVFACGPTGEHVDDRQDDAFAPSPDDAGPCTRMDLVFVVDDSDSMEAEQANLRANFARFASLLRDYRNPAGEAVDFRIAVTTTGRDMQYFVNPNPPFPIPGLPTLENVATREDGDNGAFQDGCGLLTPWVDGSNEAMPFALECLADVGVGGASIEMPLLMAQWALGNRVADGTNTGFLRDDALLGLVMMTDEDDCSRTDDGFLVDQGATECDRDAVQDVGEAVQFFDALKQGRGRWAAAVIAGLSACESSFGGAAEATRLKAFAAAAGDNVTTSSICEGDLTVALQDALDTFTAACDLFPNPY